MNEAGAPGYDGKFALFELAHIGWYRYQVSTSYVENNDIEATGKEMAGPSRVEYR